MNPYDVIDPDELVKFRRHLVARKIKGELTTLDIRVHDSMRAISVRGYLSQVLSLHDVAQQMGLGTMGSRRELEYVGTRELVYGVVWYTLPQRPLSLPDDLNLMKEAT